MGLTGAEKFTSTTFGEYVYIILEYAYTLVLKFLSGFILLGTERGRLGRNLKFHINSSIKLCSVKVGNTWVHQRHTTVLESEYTRNDTLD